MARIYADNAATTKMSEAAKNTLLRCLEEGWANPSSLHTPGQIAAERLQQARQTIAACLNARAGGNPFHLRGKRGGQPGIDQLGRRRGEKGTPAYRLFPV